MTLTRRGLLAGIAVLLPMTRLRAGTTAHRLTVDPHERFPLPPRAGRRAGADLQAASIRWPDCLGGAAHLATAIARSRAAAEAAGRTVLLLDAGDQFQGSLFYTAWHGDAELAVMHALGTEAMAVGNHEFDNGPANLARFVRAAKFPGALGQYRRQPRAGSWPGCCGPGRCCARTGWRSAWSG